MGCSFLDKKVCSPFVIQTDSEYYKSLRNRYTHFINLLKKADANKESIRTAEKFANKICEAVRDYYHGKVGTCHQKIENLIKRCLNSDLAVSAINDSKAFPGKKGSEVQLFRARRTETYKTFMPKEMLHLPFSQRGKTGNYRFSIPGVTSLYLANSSYGCWLEMGRPAEHDFNVSPVVLDGSQRIFNLAVSTRMVREIETEKQIQCWIELLMLMMATSYRIEERERSFRSEYIISQSVMLACKKMGCDGVAYFSKQVEDEAFAHPAVNLALFAEYQYGKEYGNICNHIKIDESMNYQFFKQLTNNENYPLRIIENPYITNIGTYNHQYSYFETTFFKFDKYLFSRWENTKSQVPWGNATL